MSNTLFIQKTAAVAQTAMAKMTKLETWTWGLFNAVVVGGSTSVSSWLGMTAAKAVGVDVPVLNFKSLGVIFLSGAAVRFFAYLSQGLPVPNGGPNPVTNTPDSVPESNEQK